MKNKINLFKSYARTVCQLIDSYTYDIIRYIKHSQMVRRFRSRKTARAHLLLSIHALEKGLALPSPRAGFGKDKCRSLLIDLYRFHQRFSDDSILVYACEVLSAVIEFHRKGNVEDTELSKLIEDFKSKITKNDIGMTRQGGLIERSRACIIDSAPKEPLAFFNCRHSVREFSPKPIDDRELELAFIIAQLAPSVCNRQSGRIHYTTEPDVMKNILACQNGNSGFGDQATAVIIVTSEVASFNKPGERNQMYIDGGLFAMNLVLGLHSLGIGSCFLNWSATASEDKKLRKTGIIPDSESIIALILAGNLKEHFKVASSPRLPLGEIMKKH